MSKSMIQVVNTHTFEADYTGVRPFVDDKTATFIGWCSETDNNQTPDEIFALSIWKIMAIIESPDGSKCMMYPKGSKNYIFSMKDAMNGVYDDILNFCTSF